METKRIDAIDLLRGIAILAVISLHLSVSFGPDHSPLSFVCSQGGYGVQLFFIVSALTMCEMWERRSNEPNPAIRFYIRRFFRIAGPFWLAIIFYRTLYGFGPSDWAPDGISVRHIITTALFVHTFWPDTISSVVPGGWSIGVEMLFYLFFPLLIAFRGGPRFYVTLGFVTYVANLTLVRPLYETILTGYGHDRLVNDFLLLQFLNQAPIFILGIGLFKLLSGVKLNSVSIAIAACWIMLAVTLKYLFHVQSSPWFWTAIFSMLVFAYVVLSRGISWAPLDALGEVSYSVYLSHFAIIDGVALAFSSAGLSLKAYSSFAAAALGVIALSWIAGLVLRRLVERPSTDFARFIIERMTLGTRNSARASL